MEKRKQVLQKNEETKVHHDLEIITASEGKAKQNSKRLNKCSRKCGIEVIPVKAKVMKTCETR